MNTHQAPDWLPSYLIPFFTLSYPTAPPAVPDSFPNSSYYTHGYLDGCLIVTFIAAMAILRDVARLWVLEPFARWKLTRDLRLRKNAKAAARANGNGKANGTATGHRNGEANGIGREGGVVNKRSATGVENGNGHAVHANGNEVPVRANGKGHTEYAAGISITKKEKNKMHRSVLRFAEQGWSVIYYSCVWALGLYVHYNVPTRVLDPVDAWRNYPHMPLAGPVKFYYLLETAFYCHQILIINAEARRKDHWQMMTHHVVTIVLMVGSYFYNYTRVGCITMMIMDYCDIILPLAKMFRYLSFSTLCDMTFVWFLLSWAVTRHVLFILVIKSTWDAHNMIPRLWGPDSRRFTAEHAHWAFLVMLIILQVIQIMWFWMICRVAWRVVSGQGAEDERSDDEFDGSTGEEDTTDKKER